MAQTREDALQEAINGLPRVAEVIAAIPANARLKALTAVEGSYRQSALDLGYNDSEAQCWVDAIMFRLRDELDARQSSEEKEQTGRTSIDFLHVTDVGVRRRA
jgi:hypothetical protein